MEYKQAEEIVAIAEMSNTIHWTLRLFALGVIILLAVVFR